jgi:hypothetical protein
MDEGSQIDRCDGIKSQIIDQTSSNFFRVDRRQDVGDATLLSDERIGMISMEDTS